MPKYLEEVTNGQPFVLILGSLMEPSQCFVIVERKALIQGSLLKAVDVCFKVFYILDISYPWQCSTTWEFFQKVVFGLDDAGGNSKTSPAVIAMRTTLKKVCSVEHWPMYNSSCVTLCKLLSRLNWLSSLYAAWCMWWRVQVIHHIFFPISKIHFTHDYF